MASIVSGLIHTETKRTISETVKWNENAFFFLFSFHSVLGIEPRVSGLTLPRQPCPQAMKMLSKTAPFPLRRLCTTQMWSVADTVPTELDQAIPGDWNRGPQLHRMEHASRGSSCSISDRPTPCERMSLEAHWNRSCVPQNTATRKALHTETWNWTTSCWTPKETSRWLWL